LLWKTLVMIYPNPGFFLEAGVLTAVICAGVAIYGVGAYILGLPELKLCMDYAGKILRRLFSRRSEVAGHDIG
ncbi:MAG: hypothetical protein WAO30_05785, partial [Thermacetogeniaceae bacterium]